MALLVVGGGVFAATRGGNGSTAPAIATTTVAPTTAAPTTAAPTTLAPLITATPTTPKPTAPPTTAPKPTTPPTPAPTAPPPKPVVTLPRDACNGLNPVYTLPLVMCDEGFAVEILQIRLNRRGAGLDEDGQFGPATQIAVMAFQRDYGLTVNGIVDYSTWYEMFVGETNMPGTDFDGDGVVTPGEFYAD